MKAFDIELESCHQTLNDFERDLVDGGTYFIAYRQVLRNGRLSDNIEYGCVQCMERGMRLLNGRYLFDHKAVVVGKCRLNARIPFYKFSRSVTEKMKSAINFCERFSAAYTGDIDNYEAVSAFLDKHLENAKKQAEMITEAVNNSMFDDYVANRISAFRPL